MAGRDDDHEPLDLGTVTPGAADHADASAHPHRPHPRDWLSRLRRPAALGLALVAGIVIGVAATEARDGTEARLVGTVLGPSADLPNGEIDSLVVAVVNTGPDDVQIVGIDVDGFLVREADLPEPVTAPVGRWVRYEAPTVPDCTGEPSDDVRVRLRDDSGERSVGLATPSGDRSLTSVWTSLCG